MAIAVRSFSSATANYGANTNTLAAPAGVSSGDLLVLCVMISKEMQAPPTGVPAGFTLAGTNPSPSNSGSNGASSIYWKAATGAEPGNYGQITTATSGSIVAGLICFTGADTTNPFDVTPSWKTGTTNPLTTNSITVGNTGSCLVCLFHNLGGGRTFSTAAGMTELADVNGGYGGAAFDYQLGVSAGATGAKSSTVSSLSQTWQTCAFSITPPVVVAAKPPAGFSMFGGALAG